MTAVGEGPETAFRKSKTHKAKETKTMLEKMKEIIAEQLSVDAESITEASSFKDDLFH